MARWREVGISWRLHIEGTTDDCKRQLQEPLILVEGMGHRSESDERDGCDPRGIGGLNGNSPSIRSGRRKGSADRGSGTLERIKIGRRVGLRTQLICGLIHTV